MSLSNNNDENGEQDLSDGWSKVEDEGQSSSLSDDITRQSLNVTGESDKSVRNQSTSYLSSRANSWINLLGVRNKPDPLTDWDNLYNLKNQSLLRKDCQKLIQQRSNISSRWTVPEIESLMTLYCKRRNVGYEQDKGWLEILGKLLEFPFDKCNLFNVFWAITTKYIPRSPKMFDLLRLLMQYHDPQLCSFLDSFKIQSSEFTSFWLRTLLCVNMDDDLCNLLWDRYFEKGDPFLIFFVSLAFVQSVKDEILLLTERDKILNLLKDIPSKMTRDDLTDLLEICLIHANHGNQSVINYLTDQLNKATTSAVRHGGCLGLGLAALGTRSVKIYEHLRECLYSQNEAVSGEGAGIAMGLVLAGSMNQSAFDEMRSYILDTQHDKIQRGLRTGIAMLAYGMLEKAEPWIEILESFHSESIMRQTAVCMIAMAYAGSGNAEVVKRLLEKVAADPSSDVKRFATIAIGFVLSGNPELCLSHTGMLFEHFNGHIRYGAAIALGIACAGSGYKESVSRLEPLLQAKETLLDKEH
uniref:Rab-GAP TBC domain-containing protein n=1 Tax=Meloidogyne incognita TaxID=6306 RepID=A0A914NR30_MELIC